MVTIKGIDCYGEMSKTQNVHVICEDEMYDDIWGDGFDTWQEAVKKLTLEFPSIVEMEAV